jgi:hypothetical protein
MKGPGGAPPGPSTIDLQPFPLGIPGLARTLRRADWWPVGQEPRALPGLSGMRAKNFVLIKNPNVCIHP